MVCEAVLDYICNMEIYSAEEKKLEGTVLSILDRNVGQNHHIYQVNFYTEGSICRGDGPWHWWQRSMFYLFC
jgi:hypothetical protein